MLKKILFAGVAIVLTATPAFADEFSAVSTIDKAVTVTDADGSVSIKYVKADRVVPGDKLFYTISYSNTSPDAAENVELVMKVPAEVTYSENSAKAPDARISPSALANEDVSVSFSTDGGKSFAPRGDLTVSVSGQNRNAVSEDITNVRFSFSEPIPIGVTGTVGFSAIVR